MKNYDLVVIGGGVGLYLADAALQKGQSCALVERGKMGGTCLTRGCIPSKILVHVADLYREIQQAARIGLHADVGFMDWERISERVWKKIDQSKQIESDFGKLEKLDLYKGTARFIDQHTLQVEADDGSQIETLQGRNIIIATGGRTFVPPVKGLEEVGYLTAETFFGEQYPAKPWRSLTILGGGAIGLEFAHIFSALGTKITLLEMNDRLAGTEEPEISDLLAKQMESIGVRVLTGFKAESAGSTAEGKKIIARDKDGKTIETVSEEILIAAGIRSNGDLLGLENTKIKTDDKGWIITDEYLATSQKNVWAIGDINGKFQFRHKANYEAEVLAHNLFSESEKKRQARYNVVPWAIFTYPQVAHVGLTEEQAVKAGHTVLVGKNPYSAVANGYAMGYEDDENGGGGFVKLVTNDKHKILGVHIIGTQAAILIQPYVYLMNAGVSCERQKTRIQSRQVMDGRVFSLSGRSQRSGCLDADTTDAIDQAMIIHPALSEVAGWVTGELESTGL